MKFRMRILLYLAVAMLFIAGPALADCQMVRAAVIPLLSTKRPVIEASINGKTVQMVVDTGASTSSVTPETVASLGLPRDLYQKRAIHTIGGLDVSNDAILKKLSFSTIDYSNRNVMVVALDGTETLAGIIGADILMDFDLDLDIPRRTLTLYRVGGCKPSRPPWEGQYQIVMASVSGNRQFLLPVELNGHTVNALFDTGSLGETVSRAAARSIGITNAQLDNDPSTSGTSGGMHGYAIRRHRFDTFKIGTETFHDGPQDVADFHQPGVDMMIGVDFMHWRRIFVSYSTSRLFIQKESDDAIRKELVLQSHTSGANDPCRPSREILLTVALKPPVVVSRPKMDISQRVQADHINGCAAAMYHLTPDGTPIDLKQVMESPTGYGLGELIVRELAATKFLPTPTETKWYYEVHRFRSLP
jgi:predicted aspartyl protease